MCKNHDLNPSTNAGKSESDDKEAAVDKEGSDTESAEDSNSATKVNGANGHATEQNGNTPKVHFFLHYTHYEPYGIL